MIDRRDGSSRSVRGQMNPYCCALRLNQRRGEDFFLIQASLDGCTGPEQEWTSTILLQADVGVDDDDTTMILHKPPLARSLRDRRRTDSSEGWHHGVPSNLTSLTLEGSGKAVMFPSRQMSVSCTVYPYVLCSCVFLFFSCLQNFSKEVERRGFFFIKDGSDWDAYTRWMKLDIVNSICVNERYYV